MFKQLLFEFTSAPYVGFEHQLLLRFITAPIQVTLEIRKAHVHDQLKRLLMVEPDSAHG